MWITSSLTTAITPTAIALGNFDGVHLGHQAVIQQVLSPDSTLTNPDTCTSPPTAHPANTACPTPFPSTSALQGSASLRGFSQREGLGSAALPSPETDLAHREWGPLATPIPTVMTFFPHPQEFFSGQSRPLLTPLPEKAAYISRLGIGQLVLLPFNHALAALSPQEFVETLLIKQLKVKHISVGKDFCFGKNRQGTADDLKTLAQRYGVEVHITPLTCLGTERISSSRIRAALNRADLASAEALLGRPYSLTGRVIRGQQLGRTLGFPTANLSLPTDKFLPSYGVYSVWVQGATAIPGQSLPGVMNIGVRPTVNGLTPTAEVHLLHWTGDLYGKTLQVFLQHYVRSEQAFDSLDSLKAQIQQDCQVALASLAKSPVGNLS